MPSKITMNQLFNDIRCCLFIACLIEKFANSCKGLLYPEQEVTENGKQKINKDYCRTYRQKKADLYNANDAEKKN